METEPVNAAVARRIGLLPPEVIERIASLRRQRMPGKEIAKSVLVRTNHGYALAVLPATHRVDLEQLRQDLGEETIALASENEMQQVFPDCERGAMPPFGSLYDLHLRVFEREADQIQDGGFIIGDQDFQLH